MEHSLKEFPNGLNVSMHLGGSELADTYGRG